MRLTWWKNGSCWFVGMALLGGYLAILPQDLTWANFGGDSGDFLAAILSGGVPHPSGYPTYILLGSLFQHIPFGTIYWKIALLSAFPAALAAALVGRWVQTQLFAEDPLGWLAGCVAGLVWGSAPLFFSQAVIVEVYGLHWLAVAGWLWWLVWIDRPGKDWKLCLLSAAVGLSIGNHLTILLLAPAVVWIFIRVLLKRKNIGFFLLQAGLIALAGAIPYIALILRASANPGVNWGGAQSWDGLVWLVSGSAYQNLLVDPAPGQIIERLSAWANELVRQFGLIGILMGAWGVVQFPSSKSWVRWLLIWIFTVYSVFAIFYRTSDSLIYLVPALLPASIWIGTGVWVTWNVRVRERPYGKWLAGLVVLVIVAKIPFTILQVDPRKDQRAVNFMQYALQALPPDALILTERDAETFPLWYLHFGLRQQPGWRIVVLPLTQFEWYRQNLAVVYPDLTLPEAEEDWSLGLPAANPDRVVCRVLESDRLIGSLQDWNCSSR